MTHAATILVVDDDAGVAALQRRVLERMGYRVLVAARPDEALRRLEERAVALILLDHGLPGEDGLTFFGRLQDLGVDVPVILVTGHGDLAIATRALRAGVRDFVVKSAGYLDYLPDAVARVLGQVAIERRLDESQAKLAAVFASARDAIVVADERGRITLFNPAAERMFRCPEREAAGQPLARFLPELGAGAPGEALPAAMPLGLELGRRADGELFPIEATISPVEGGGMRSYTAIVRDVTDRRRLETELLHAQRLEALGRLAGGIAHDFNNLLTVISGYTELLLSELEPDDRLREPIGLIRQAGDHAAALTRQLLAFSRRQAVQPGHLDLNLVVSNLARLLRRLIGEDIELTLDLAPGVLSVRADQRQLEQVLMNLAVNARDAMPRGGQLRITTAVVGLSDQEAARLLPAAPAGRYVCLTVRDTGCGMDARTRERIFEPFFTTKEVGKGTGLGLSTVYGIVTQADGHLQVTSEPGKGTTFEIYLPAQS